MRTSILTLLVLPTAAWPQSFVPERFREEARFGSWTVLCDSFDDMGGVTYFECAATPGGQIFVRTVDNGFMFVAPGTAEVVGISTTPCQARQCSSALSRDDLLTGVQLGVTVDGASVVASGLDEAMGEMGRLVD